MNLKSIQHDSFTVTFICNMFHSYKGFLPNLLILNTTDSRYSQTLPLRLLGGRGRWMNKKGGETRLQQGKSVGTLVNAG